MGTDANCNIVVALSPTGYDDVWPKCRISFNDVVEEFVLDGNRRIEINTKINRDTDLIIEFHGKENKDSIVNKDLRINIDSLSIMGIENKKFIYRGVYHPRYPEPWASQQRAQGRELKEQLPHTDSMGWNGRWILTITNPPFSFIHRTLDHGWIYPTDHLG